MSTSGIPVKLLNEAQGHTVSLELTTGETYRGKLVESEDNMNCQLRDVTATARNGQVTHMDHVFVRGSHVRFFVVPDMFKNAPLFKSESAHKPPPPIRGPRRK
ncbi:AaceriAGL157Cp [[Ashbya] aceris (nom. inval.)]|nr:AaceriAGL157Cp [[Ashbya] aceris (nom. inval.)]